MITKWYELAGIDSDIAVSTRVRLARNFSNIPFPNRMTAEQAQQVLDRVSEKMLGSAGGIEFRLVDMSNKNEAESLVERHLISREMALAQRPCGAILSRDDSVSVMVNEEDHLRIQIMGSGFCLDDCLRRAESIDKLLEEGESMAFDTRKGYLTSCPTNLGTGLRAGVMLHLPALTESGAIRGIVSSAEKLGFAVRGLYGEGTKAIGAMYQFSNQLTLGMTEEETVSRLSEAVKSIIAQERAARINMSAENPTALEDKVWRAAGTLASARLMTSDEAHRLLSDMRLGVSMGLLKGITIEKINRLQWEVGPASITELLEGSVTPAQRDKKRSELMRQSVSAVFDK
ncbi:MAG: protein arginine kinase [Ruminococcaceae bacterium]|nr:protein arginine kinase [Oscillospiraceae bacterium]